MEADPAGGDLAARYRLPVTPGLVSLAAVARQSVDPELVGRHTQLLAGGLPVVVGPTRPDQARAALGAIIAADGEAGVFGSFAGRDDVVAVVDCGRLAPESAAGPVVEVADELLIVARPRADELAHVADYVAARHFSPGVTQAPVQARLVLVGPGYPAAEVAREVGLAVAGTIPWDPRTADAVSGQDARAVRAKAGLVQAATRLAGDLARSPRDTNAGQSAGGAVPAVAHGVDGALSGSWSGVSPNGSTAPRGSWP